MKKSLHLIYLSFLISASSLAQAILNFENTVPELSSDCTYHQFSGFSPGESGINATWDMSTFMPSESVVINYLPLASTPLSEVFGEATFASEILGNYEYFKADENVYSKIGAFTQNLLVDYNDPQDILRFPFTYEDEFSDSFEGSYSYQGLDITIKGTIDAHADAYGTLILPYGQVEDVIRVKYVSNYHEYVEINNQLDSLPYYVENYVWYKKGLSHVLTMTHLEIEGETIADLGSYLDQAYVGINDEFANAIKFNIYPNPTNERLNLEFNLHNEQEISIDLYSILGAQLRNISNQQLKSGYHSIPIDLKNQAEGTYLLKVNFEGKQICKTVIIQ